jgi:bilirubin oxidase
VLGASAGALGFAAGGGAAGARLVAARGLAQDQTPSSPAVAEAPTPEPGPVPAGVLRLPPLLAPKERDGARVFDLTLQQGRFEIHPGQPVATLGINGPYLGPTLRVKQGDTFLAQVTNHLGEETTLHWHGMHVPAAMDGGPHQVIPDGGTWRPRFAIAQQAATLWFHSHLMGKTAEQVTRGLAGMLIVDDDNPAQAALPHTYGVDDLPLLVQDDVLGPDGRTDGGGRGRAGRLATLVNGSVAPAFVTPRGRLRLRLLNASGRSLYTFGFADDRTFHQIATDGGLLPEPVAATRLRLGPAERAEIVVDVDSAGPAVLQSSRFGDAAEGEPLLTISSLAEPGERAPLPARLNTIDPLPPEGAAVNRAMVLGGGGRGRTINGQSMTSMEEMHDMGRTMQVRLGDVELWTIINASRDTHAFHVHDVQFQILDRSGAAPAANDAGRKDTVVVRPAETVRIIMRFADYADPQTPYMFHCHVLQHEDQGMMGQFVVVP